MEEEIEQAVARVVESMRENLSEPLTIDDMARTAMFSKFHFSRIFRRATGLSPGRFLSAMRLQKAKELLLTTSLNVVDISYEVGYNSVGTFSSRFTRSVGLSPTAYRQLQGVAPDISTEHRSGDSTRPPGAIHGAIHCPSLTHRPGRVLVGLFPDRFSMGRPIKCAVVDAPQEFLLHNIPQGTWHLIATCVAVEHPEGTHSRSSNDKTSHILCHGLVQVRSNAVVSLTDLRLNSTHLHNARELCAMPDNSDAA